MGHTPNYASARLVSRGTKRTCAEADCGERFYDLNKAPMVCPYCGAAFVPLAEVPLKSRARSGAHHYRLEAPPPVADKADAEEVHREDVDFVETVSVDDADENSVPDGLLDSDDDGDEAPKADRKAVISDDN